MVGSKWHWLIWTGIMVILLMAAGGCKTRAQYTEEQAKERMPSLVGITVSPIHAVFDQKTFSTTYWVESAGESPDTFFLARWSGPDCGNWSVQSQEEKVNIVSNAYEFKWYHPHPPCPETTNHEHVDVSLELRQMSVDGKTGKIRETGMKVICTYHGSETGTGKEPVWQY